MKLRNAFMCYWLFMSLNSFSQVEIGRVKVSELTDVMIKKYYTSSEIDEMKNDSDKIKMMDYNFSKSFEIVAGQNYSQDQILLIDILKYRLDRKIDEDVFVFDPVSNLNLKLLSLNKVDQDRKLIVPSYITHDERGKNKAFIK